MSEHTYIRRFSGPWETAWVEMQVYLLEMLAAHPTPIKLDLRFAEKLVTKEQYGNDFRDIRAVLESRLGKAFLFDTIADAQWHEITFVYEAQRFGWLGKVLGKQAEQSANERARVTAKPRRRVIVTRRRESTAPAQGDQA